MTEHFTGNPKRLFNYWQDSNRAKKFLSGGTREAAINFCRSFKDHFTDKVWADIGTGTGYVVKSLLKDFRPKAVIGIDISKAMLSMYQVDESLLSIGSGFNLPLRQTSVDVVSSFFCFSDYPSLRPVFKEGARVLNHHGKFLYVDYAKGDGYWELRKKHHGENGIVGNINLRTTEEILAEIDQFTPIFSGYVEAEVPSEHLKAPFELPPTITRKFAVCLASRIRKEDISKP